MEVCTGDHDDLDRDTTRQVVQVVTALGHAFTKLVDLMLSREIRVSGPKKSYSFFFIHFHFHSSSITARGQNV